MLARNRPRHHFIGGSFGLFGGYILSLDDLVLNCKFLASEGGGCHRGFTIVQNTLKPWVAQTLHPSTVALQGVGTPLLRLFPQFRACRRGVAATPSQKGPCRAPSRTRLQGVAGSLDLRNPVALQGVERLHLRVSRYTLTLS